MPAQHANGAGNDQAGRPVGGLFAAMRRHPVLLASLAALGLVAVVLLLAPEEPATAAAASAARPPPPDAPDPAPLRSQAVAGAILRGSVVDAAGAPVAGAEVTVLLAGAPGIVAASVRAGAAGRFVARELGPGDYLLVARKGAAVSPPVGPVPLAPGEELSELVLALAPGASVAGVVVDAGSRAPIPGARVLAAGLAAYCDSSGAFSLTGLSPGTALLRAEAPGYEPREQSLELTAGPVSGLALALARGAQIRGTVLDPAGQTVAGAAVWTVPYRLGRAAAGASGGTTDAAGAFEVQAPAGQVRVEAVSPAGASGSAVVDLAPGGILEGLTLRLSAPASLEGRVLAGSAPAAGAEVRVAGTDGATLAQAHAGADGRFAVPGLPPGPVTVSAAHGAGRGVVGPIDVGEGETREVEIVLGSGSITGWVVDGTGRAVAGASVAGWPEGAPRELAATALSGPRGTFELVGLPAGLLRLEAASGAARGELRGLSAGATDVRLTLGAGFLVGLVTADGRPATDFTVSAAPVEPGRSGARAERLLAPDGRFRLALPAGRYEVRVSAPGSAVATAQADVPATGDSRELRLALSSGGAVLGTVVDAADGSPVPGARISTSRSGTLAFGRATGFPAPGALSDETGRFRLEGVPPGPARIFAWAPGYLWEAPLELEVRAGAPAQARLALTRGHGREPESFGGVGITLASQEGQVVAAEVVEGGPSFEAGVRRGDRFRAVDGAQVASMRIEEVARRIRGRAGTPVVLELLRPGAGPFRVVVPRTELRF